MAFSQTNFLTTLAYLLGERTVNSTTSAPRADFVQETLREAYQAFPWRFSRGNATLAISNGVATLPTDYDVGQESHIKFGAAPSEITIDEVNEFDSEQIQDGDRAAWIYAVSDDRYVLRLRDSDVTYVDFKYHKVPPTLDSAGSVLTPYPNKMTIAYGARRYVKLSENPDADISQDEKIFQRKLSSDIAFHQVNAPRKRRKTAHSQTGTSTGDW